MTWEQTLYWSQRTRRYNIYYLSNMIKKSQLIVLLAVFLLLTVSWCFKCELGEIQKWNKCVSCKDILFTKQPYLSSAFYSDYCQCEQGYQWSYTLKECVDEIKKSARIMQVCTNSQIVINGNCFDCPGADQYGTGLASGTSCTCITNFQWSPTPTGGSCSPLCKQQKGFISYSQAFISSSRPKLCTNCRLIPFALGANIDAGSCACNPAFAYQPSFYTCYCYLSSYIEPINNKCVPCAQLGSTLVASCNTCSAPFKKSLSGCYYAPSIPNGSSATSGCVTGYTFHFYRGKCICNFNLRYSIDLNGICTLFTTANPDGYYCTRSFVLDRYQCKHGSLIPNYDFTTTYACKAGFVFKYDRFTQRIISCACSAAALNYVSGDNCNPCSGSLPSGVSQSSCTSCSQTAGFHKGEIECIYCPAVANAVGTATLDGCDCATNYFWNANTAKCQCDYVLGFIPGSTPNTCINCQNIANTDSTMFPESCSCVTSYKWNPSTKTCDCDTTSPNIFLDNGICINCATMEGSTGVSNANGTCQCMNSFYWNPAFAKCVCDFTQNYVVFSNGLCTDCIFAKFSNGLANSFGCVCISGLVWDRTTAKCVCPSGNVMIGMTCTSCSASGILPSGVTASDCNACTNSKGFALDSIGCYLCSSQTGASSTVTNGKCTCTASSSQAWVPHLGSCVCDWAKTYATKLLSTGSFSCILCPYKTSGGVCDCDSQYNQILDPENNICSDRQSDSNFNYPYMKCDDGFIWSQASYPYKCVPQGEYYGYLSLANNASVLCSSASNAATCSVCNVNSGYLLVFGIHRCLLCSTVTGATGLAKINQCPCTSSTNTWNQVTFKCDVSNCGSGRKYNPSKKLCECDPVLSILVGSNCISCASISKSNGYATSTTSCGCTNGISWVPSSSGGSCGNPVCNTNTQITLPSGACFTCPTTNGPGTASGTNCNCNTNYIWDSVTQTCVCDSSKAITLGSNCVLCSSIPQSTGTPTNPTTCGCNSPLIWATNGSCICNPSTQIILTNGNCFICPTTNGNGSPSGTGCNCNTNYVWNLVTLSCICDSSKAVTIGSSCVACSSITNSEGTVVNPTTCACKSGFTWAVTQSTGLCSAVVCSSTQIPLPNGNCFNCPTTNGPGTANGAVCNCNTNYIWDADTLSCKCDSSKAIILASSCVSCSSIPQSTGIPSSSTACGCITPLVWATNGTCICNPTTQIILPNGDCFTCPSVNGTGTSNGKDCKCLINYVWDSSTLSCICNSPNTIILLGNCFDCRTLLQSTGFALNSTACKCIEGYQWVVSITSGVCLNTSCNPITQLTLNNDSCFNCPTINGTGIANGSVCTCAPNYTWKPAVSGGSCICEPTTSISIGGNCIKCSLLVRSNGVVVNPTTCGCISPATWSNNGSCNCNLNTQIILTNNTCYACPTLNGAGTSTGSACRCNTNFVWDASVLKCVCDPAKAVTIAGKCVLCSAIAKTTGQAINETACGCISPFSWINNVCVCNPITQITLSNGNCFDCPVVEGSGGANGTNCRCPTNFVWVKASLTCVCDSTRAIIFQGNCIACNTIAQSTGAALNSTACRCNTPLVWSNGACACNPTTQITLPNGTCVTCPSTANNGTGAANSNNNTCRCPAGFLWTATATGGSCICQPSISFVFKGKCTPCSLDSFSTGAGAGNGSCICKQDYYWLVTTSKASCVPCQALPNFIRLANQTCYVCGAVDTFTSTKKVSAQNNSCNCNITTLKWDPRGFCDCGTTSVLVLSGNTYTCYVCNNPAAFTSTKVDSYTCSCTSSALQWNPLSRSCSCPFGAIIIGTGSSASCFTCPTKDYIIGASASQTSCICIGNLVWSGTSKSCGCPTGQVIIGADSTTKCIACSAISYAVQLAGAQTCTCLGSGLVFNPLNGGSCSCPQNNIISPTFTCVPCPAGTNPLTPYECRCQYGFIWSYSQQTCKQCGVDISDAQQGMSTSVACICKTGFTWDVMTQTCISASTCGIVAPSCMKCPSGNAVKLSAATARRLTGGNIIESSLNGAFTNYNKIKIYQCTCSSGFVWDFSRLLCFASKLL